MNDLLKAANSFDLEGKRRGRVSWQSIGRLDTKTKLERIRLARGPNPKPRSGPESSTGHCTRRSLLSDTEQPSEGFAVSCQRIIAMAGLSELGFGSGLVLRVSRESSWSGR